MIKMSYNVLFYEFYFSHFFSDFFTYNFINKDKYEIYEKNN